ncbi:hypothetical protein ACFP1Z_32665, partial [Streptomyces gamaensis]
MFVWAEALAVTGRRRSWAEGLRRCLRNAGMSAWQLADLLGVHEHDVTMDALPNQPLNVVL